MVKRVLAMLAMLMLILAVAGCGSSGSGGDEELQKVATPVIAPKGEKYFNSTEITITTETDGAVIRYTTDGSEPDSDSKIYNSAITITATTTIKAKAFKDGMTESDTVTEIFTIQEVGLEKIEITSQPTKTSYYVRDKTLDITGLEVTGTYNNGSNKIETVLLSNISGFDTTTSGEKTLTVTLSGKTATFKITVVDLILTGITVIIEPTKTSYYVGDKTLDITGLNVMGTYNNGSNKIETVSLSNISGFNTTTSGEKTLTVTLLGKTATFKITVIDGEKIPERMVLVPAGESNPLNSGRRLSNSCYIGKYEVTQAEWQAVMNGNSNGISATPSYFAGKPNNPVEEVSGCDIFVFCNRKSIQEGLTPVYSINNSTNPNEWGTIPTSWDATWEAVIINSSANGYRLPTESEWAYAAIGGPAGVGKITDYAGSNNIEDVAWYKNNNTTNGEIYGTKAVGRKMPNELGIYDMSGNVCEWCSYGDYGCIIGGSWSDSDYYCNIKLYGRSIITDSMTYRNLSWNGHDYGKLGFRLARSF